jgi:hypothetical protein
MRESNSRCDEVCFEFYLISYQQILESLQESNKSNEENFEQTTSMDLDQVWVLALRVLHLFEDSITQTYPSS